MFSLVVSPWDLCTDVSLLADLSPCLQLANIPVYGETAMAEPAAMNDTHVFNILPAYDIDGNLIMPKDYESSLKGALVVVSATLNHYDIRARGPSPASNTFVAEVVKIRVLQPPVEGLAEKVARKRVPTKDNDFVLGSSSKRARVV